MALQRRRHFKAPFLTKEDIETVVNQIRSQYPSTSNLPFDILGFAEFELSLEFDFAPISQLGQDAFLRPDLSGIWFDPVAFREHAFQHRLRFSAAHELGHLFLHKNVYGALDFHTVKQWIAFIESIPVREYQWMEWHANEFAGRFLIPTETLGKAIDEVIADAEIEGYIEQGAEEALEFCARAIKRDFGVSYDAMQTRIRKSEFWPHPKIRNSN